MATVLYKQGLPTGDENYNRALRLAVLGNPLLPKQLMSRNTFGVIEDEEVLRFITTDDFKEELSVILRNPEQRSCSGVVQPGEAIRQNSREQLCEGCALVAHEPCHK